MRDQELVNALREHAEWAEGNQWETPITLCDDLAEAADRIANQNTHIAALQREIEGLRGQLPEPPEEEIDMDHEAAETLRQLCRNCDLDRLEKLAEADRDGRLVVLPFTSGRTLLCKENIDSPQLMKDVELAIRYCSSCGIVFHMGYNVFCDLVKHGRITAVSEETEKVLGAMKDA